MIGEFLSDYYNDNRGWLITILIAVSGFSLLGMFVRRSQVLKIENKEKTPVNALSAGDVEIVGKVKSVGESIISPTGHNCVYYASYWMNWISTGGSAEHGGSNISCILVADDIRSSSFVIADESGEIVLDLSDVQYQSSHGFWINEFKGIRIKNPKRSPIGGILSSEYEEYNLKAGDDFYYNGVISVFNDKDKTEITELPPIISKQPEWTLPEIPTGTRKWKLEGGTIGNKTEDEIVNCYKRGMNISLVVTVILWVTVIFLHFVPMSTISKVLQLMGES